MSKSSIHDRRRKLRDVAEFRRWYEAGYSYRQMSEMYLEKYGEVITPTAFSNWRARLGLRPRASVRDRSLIPWEVKDDHATLLPMRMLRAENRRRSRLPLEPSVEHRLDAWLVMLSEHDVVVHYEPDTEKGFFYVPRRKGIDNDLVRVDDA